MIALLTATWDEIRALRNEISVAEEGSSGDLSFLAGKLFNKSIVAAETGVGIRRARTGASYIIQKFKPTLIISAGFGGALTPEFKVGDVVVGGQVLSLKKNEIIELFDNFSQENGFLKKGLILTESRFINLASEKKQLASDSKALVVDMETWGVAEASKQSKTPVASIRAVSDEATDELPDMGALYDSSGKFDFDKSDCYFKENPNLIIPYLKFRFTNTPAASEALSRFLTSLFQDNFN